MFFHVHTERSGAWTLVRVVGDLDLSTAPSLRTHVLAALADGAQDLALDLDGVGFCDSVGLGVVIGALKRVRERHGRFAVLHAPPSFRTALAITGLDAVIDCPDELPSAVGDAASELPT